MHPPHIVMYYADRKKFACFAFWLLRYHPESEEQSLVVQTFELECKTEDIDIDDTLSRIA